MAGFRKLEGTLTTTVGTESYEYDLTASASALATLAVAGDVWRLYAWSITATVGGGTPHTAWRPRIGMDSGVQDAYIIDGVSNASTALVSSPGVPIPYVRTPSREFIVPALGKVWIYPGPNSGGDSFAFWAIFAPVSKAYT